MSWGEFMGWLHFFDLQNKEMKKAQAGRSYGKGGRKR